MHTTDLAYLFLLKEMGFRCTGSVYVQCYIGMHVYTQKRVNQMC